VLVTGVAGRFAGMAAYKKESAELQETEHRMKSAQELLSTIKTILPDQDKDEGTNMEEIQQVKH
jgi:hypothetical protein